MAQEAVIAVIATSTTPLLEDLLASLPSVSAQVKQSKISEKSFKVELHILDSKDDALALLNASSIAAIIDYSDIVEVSWSISNY
ncbi:MAG: hypothetical protein V2I33_23685 [Kangiellaceae bacterium]|nr:hypothetical protein [Kangiellaceae bacterium]